MKGKKWTLIVLIILFVATNLFLIFKKDSMIARTNFIKEWVTVTEQKIVLSKEKAGVVTPLEEEFVYFQNGLGDFHQFLVGEGEEVHDGTPLLEYSPRKMEDTVGQYEAEITRLESERDGLEEQIDRLDGIKRTLTTADEEDSSNQAVVSTVEMQISEKEYQLSKVEGEIEKLEELISILKDGVDSLTINSAISGVVKKISRDLQNPVVTISSHEKKVKGMLEEAELQEIAEGMKVYVTSNGHKWEGIVASVAANPEQEPHVHTESRYEFTVELTESAELEEEEAETDTEPEAVIESEPEPVLITGTHVDMKMITKEVEDALTIANTALRKGNIYVLKGNGTIEKRKVETGLSVRGATELISEAEEGELVVNNPSWIRNKSTFHTPIEFSQMRKKAFKDLGKKEVFTYLGRGFLTK